jgi:hypothetical protein
LIALNESHNGNLGGKEVADCLCARDAQHAGLSGTWKAFLSSSFGDAMDLIHDSLRTGVPVVNSQGWLLYDNWSDMFTQSGWFQGAYIYSFWYHKVKDPVWYDARGWHGSNPDGTLRTDCTCQDWTSSAGFDIGANGKLNTPIQWLSDQTTPCDSMLAVLCIMVDKKIPTDVDDDYNPTASPDRLYLSQNYPNPFNPSTTIEYTLHRKEHVEITIYNLLGQKVRVLVDELKPAGVHRANWDGQDENGQYVASGIYLYRLENGDLGVSKKMVLLR